MFGDSYVSDVLESQSQSRDDVVIAFYHCNNNDAKPNPWSKQSFSIAEPRSFDWTTGRARKTKIYLAT